MKMKSEGGSVRPVLAIPPYVTVHRSVSQLLLAREERVKRTKLPIHRQRLAHLRRLFPSDAVERELELSVLPNPLLDLLPRVRLARKELLVRQDVISAESLERGFERVDVGSASRKYQRDEG